MSEPLIKERVAVMSQVPNENLISKTDAQFEAKTRTSLATDVTDLNQQVLKRRSPSADTDIDKVDNSDWMRYTVVNGKVVLQDGSAYSRDVLITSLRDCVEQLHLSGVELGDLIRKATAAFGLPTDVLYRNLDELAADAETTPEGVLTGELTTSTELTESAFSLIDEEPSEKPSSEDHLTDDQPDTEAPELDAGDIFKAQCTNEDRHVDGETSSEPERKLKTLSTFGEASVEEDAESDEDIQITD